MKSSTILRLAGSLLAAAGFIITLTSCNTTRGVGRDVEHVGNHIERAAGH